jgi:hypothetical protein
MLNYYLNNKNLNIVFNIKDFGIIFLMTLHLSNISMKFILIPYVYSDF